jgi:hypothetical protein
VDIGSVDSIADDGLRRARVDLYIASPNRFQYRACVVRRLIECRIAMDSAHTEQFDTRFVCAKNESEGILGIL